MAAPMDASLPPFLTLADGYQIVLDAVDATTGVTVAGVVISQRSFGVDSDQGVEEIPSPSPVSGAYTTGKQQAA